MFVSLSLFMGGRILMSARFQVWDRAANAIPADLSFYPSQRQFFTRSGLDSYELSLPKRCFEEVGFWRRCVPPDSMFGSPVQLGLNVVCQG